MKKQIDRFSDRSKLYAKFRPSYPDEFYNFIFSQISRFEKAWDCGTGNGQVAIRLAKKFETVFATDLSESQLNNAFPAENITYKTTRSERTDFPDNTFNLITVGQAVHWFDLDIFYKEVTRVAKPNALLAIWGYGLCTIDPKIDKVIDRFYREITQPYWDKERAHIDESYKNISFPFKEISMPAFSINTQWKPEDMLGFLNSWSAVSNYTKANGESPLPQIEKDLQAAWKGIKEVSFPMFGKFGYIEK